MQEVELFLESTIWMARGPLMGCLRAEDRRYLDALTRTFHEKFMDRVMNASKHAAK
jgi:cell fate regulator YaaT (PSP1 superfamily)